MKKYWWMWWGVIGVLVVGLGGVSRGQGSSPGIPGQYIVMLKQGAPANRVARDHGVAPQFVYSVAVNGFAGAVPPGRLQALENDPRVAAVIPDRVVFALGKGDGKPDSGKGGGGKTGQVVPAGVTRIGAAPGSLSYTGAGVGVAVMDTGLDFNHPDLPIGSARFSAFDNTAQDGDGHGTHVGGTIAALNNNIDVVGVAPGATLYAVKVLNNAGFGSDATIMAGFDWIAENATMVNPPIRVVNVSLGRPGSLDDNPALRTAVWTVYNRGISIVVAAGNDCDKEVSQQVPATYPEVMVVASTTAQNGKANKWGYRISADTASFFTTDGEFNADGIGVTISAPGETQEDVNNGWLITSVGILSTKLGGGTTSMSGTSMAAPHVSGVVALMLQKSPLLDPESIRGNIRLSADRAGTAPLNSPTSCYTFDGEREGVVSAPGALSFLP